MDKLKFHLARHVTSWHVDIMSQQPDC